jgi:hypothetical protein
MNTPETQSRHSVQRMVRRREKPWNRCDWCGHFISLADFESGKATRKMLSHDTSFSAETYENRCAKCSPNDPSSPTAELNAKPTPESESAVGCSGLLGCGGAIPYSFTDEEKVIVKKYLRTIQGRPETEIVALDITDLPPELANQRFFENRDKSVIETESRRLLAVAKQYMAGRTDHAE